jgi:HPt (histidine-containing phosphotransfer) domain-containing protein
VLADVSASVDGDDAFVADLVRAYLADAPSHVAAIAAAVADDDPSTLVRPAHTLKSSSATVGAMRLSARSRRLEMAGREGAIDAGARGDAASVSDEWDQTAAALQAWIDR